MNSQKSIVIGALVGGVVGATATMLTTPKSGPELRNDLSAEFDQGLKKIGELKNIAINQKDDLKKDIQRFVKKEIKNGKEMSKAVQRELKEMKQELGDELEDLVEERLKS